MVERSSSSPAVPFAATAGEQGRGSRSHRGPPPSMARTASRTGRSGRSSVWRWATRSAQRSSSVPVTRGRGWTDDTSMALALADSLGDDTDTVPAVTGQLADTLYGLSGIPDAWRGTRRLEGSPPSRREAVAAGIPSQPGRVGQGQ